MFDIFKLLFTILLAAYVYNGTILDIYKPYIMESIISIAYNIIYYFSHFQIQINKLITIIYPYVGLLTDYIMTNDKSIYMIELFKDGVKTDDINDKNNIIDKELLLQNEFDLIVISDFTKPVPINKLCINYIPNNITDYEVSTVRFISFKLVYDDNVINIELNNSYYNYYVVNNVFDKSFFKYYIVNISQLHLPDMFSYNIELIDNNINMHVLDDTYSITMYKDDYGIKKQVPETDIKVENELVVENEEVEENELVVENEEVENVVLEVEEEEIVEDRINSDEFVKLDKTNCIDF
jgi:hypothetical protein